MEQKKKKQGIDEEHILACLSSSPSNAKIIQTAAHMAEAFGGQFTALFVETPGFPLETLENKMRLEQNKKLAESLGATVKTVYGEDVPFRIAEFSRVSGITRIVLGRSAVTRKHLLGKPTLTEQLLGYAPEVDIHIIPDQNVVPYLPKKVRDQKAGVLKNLAKCAGILTVATLVGLVFYKAGFTNANIIMIYILGVLLTSIATTRRVYSLIMSIASVCVFNYLFTIPRFTLLAHESGYPVTFVVMFLTAYITGTFARQYKEQASQSAKIARRTQILFDTDQLLSKADGRQEILRLTVEQLVKLLDRKVEILDGDEEIVRERYGIEEQESQLHLPLKVSDRCYGTVVIDVKEDPLDVSEHSILLSILGECALALENEKNAREKEEAAILAESEQLRANLLRSISHDLRTPLTTISGNASNLLSNGANIDEEEKQQLYNDIYDDSMWLIHLVENLLYTTRIEEGRMELRMSTELLSEIVEEALNHVGRNDVEKRIRMNLGEEFLLVKADARLMMQVVINLVDNAMKYTPKESLVTVTVKREGFWAAVEVADQGNGIPDDEKEKIFEKFYYGTGEIADNRRSLGLGLYLCKVILKAHGGDIMLKDNEPCGSIFRFCLPLEEVNVYE
ncbi:MAG: sensor histidine kinase KdpD [Firmicutes bacterium]|nr:sensor histidine kinase KdpD [Bacillota bacterium]